MRKTRIVGAAAAVGLLLFAFTAEAGRRANRPRAAKSKLMRTAESEARGTVEVKVWTETARREARTRLRVKLKRLERGADHSLWMDDPGSPATTPVRLTFEPMLSDRRGRLAFVFDTKAGDPMPFLRTVEELAGTAVQVRSADGEILAVGEVPALE